MTGSEPTIHLYPADPRFGRHVVHDPRSRGYDVRALLVTDTAPTRAVDWARRGPVYDQAACDPAVLRELGADPADTEIGCCTMAAAYGLLGTEPYHRRGRTYGMADVLSGYRDATRIDEWMIPGRWPPTDTGSAGIHAMKVLRRRGEIVEYRHAFSLPAALAALAHGPIAVGTLWYESFFHPMRRDGRFILDIARGAGVVGGHEYVLDGFDPSANLVRMTNSWGGRWADRGRAWLPVSTLERLLAMRGDVVAPVVRPRLTRPDRRV